MGSVNGSLALLQGFLYNLWPSLSVDSREQTSSYPPPVVTTAFSPPLFQGQMKSKINLFQIRSLFSSGWICGPAIFCLCLYVSPCDTQLGESTEIWVERQVWLKFLISGDFNSGPNDQICTLLFFLTANFRCKLESTRPVLELHSHSFTFSETKAAMQHGKIFPFKLKVLQSDK